MFKDLFSVVFSSGFLFPLGQISYISSSSRSPQGTFCGWSLLCVPLPACFPLLVYFATTPSFPQSSPSQHAPVVLQWKCTIPGNVSALPRVVHRRDLLRFVTSTEEHSFWFCGWSGEVMFDQRLLTYTQLSVELLLTIKQYLAALGLPVSYPALLFS